MINGFRYARRDIAKLAKEMAIFADLYDDFYRVCIVDSKSEHCTSSPTEHLIAWTKDVVGGFKLLLHRVQALVGNAKDSMIEKVAARVKWYFSEHKVKCLRVSLGVARESMRGFSNIRIIEKLDEEIAFLRAISLQGSRHGTEKQLGMSVEDQLSVLQEMKWNRRKQRHAINARLREVRLELVEQHAKIRKSDIVSENRQLLHFTMSVEKYVEKVLPSQDSGKRRRYTTSFTSNPSSSGGPIARLSPVTTVKDHNDDHERCSRCMGTCIHTAEYNESVGDPESTIPTAIWHPSISVVEAAYTDGSIRRALRSYKARTNTSTAQLEPVTPVHLLYEVGAALQPDASDDIPGHPSEALAEVKEIDSHATVIHHGETSFDVQSEPELSSDVDQEPEHMAPRSGHPDARIREVLETSSGNENESETGDEMDGEVEDNTPSPFHPVAGFRGRFPKGLQKRRERGESPLDFWHKKL